MSSFARGTHRHISRPTSRMLVLLVLALIVAGAAVIDQRTNRPTQENLASTGGVGAASAAAVSSAWYCPLLFSQSASASSSSITILNPQNGALTGTVTFVGSTGGTRDVKVNVAPRSRQSFNPGASIDAPYASALVRLAGGGASVDSYIDTGNGTASTPCASTASTNWYFADGSTESGASLQIALFNPFSDDAIVDASFDTSDQSVAAPQTFQGVVIPPMGMVVLDVSGNVRRRDWVATNISLRSGRAVAAQLQTGVIAGNPVVGYTVGQPDLTLNQYIPDIQNIAGRRSGLSLYNPSDTESEVRVENLLDKGGVAPFDLHVPAGGRVQLAFDSEQRLPKPNSLGAVVHVTNGVPVATQLTVTAVDPSPAVGGSFLTPPEQPAQQWMIASGAGVAPADGSIFVVNPGTTTATATVTLTGDGNASTQTPVKIPPGKRYVLHVNDLSPDAAASAVVNADVPVVVGREIDSPASKTLSIYPAVPVRR